MACHFVDPMLTLRALLVINDIPSTMMCIGLTPLISIPVRPLRYIHVYMTEPTRFSMSHIESTVVGDHEIMTYAQMVDLGEVDQTCPSAMLRIILWMLNRGPRREPLEGDHGEETGQCCQPKRFRPIAPKPPTQG